jgi:nicotinamidase-related amidase
MGKKTMQPETFIEQTRPFIDYMIGWYNGLQPLSLAELVDGEPESVGIVSVDVIKGFCTVGPLSSPRVNTIVPPIARLFADAWSEGVRDIALAQDAHPQDAVEFGDYPPHCIRGSEEAETVDAFTNLPFFDEIKVIEKNSISVGQTDEFNEWLDERNHITKWIMVGDCTDLCTHQLAMHVRLRANQNQLAGVRVIVPVNAVNTYDTPVDVAREHGIPAHDADFMHLTFLYHMMTNGIEVYTEITE